MPDKTLIHALRNAYNWAQMRRIGSSLNAIAATQGGSNSYVARIIPLAALSPRIQAANFYGVQPVELTRETLVRTNLPSDWQAQKSMLGFI